MELKRIIDKAYLQVYRVVNPDAGWKKEFPNASTIITYDINSSVVKLKNTNAAFDWSILTNITYIFTTLPEKAIKSSFAGLPMSPSVPLRKKCGLNASNQKLYTKENNVVLSLYSLQDFEYPPTFLTEHFDVVSNFDEIMSLEDQQLQNAICKMGRKHMRTFKSFVDFVNAIKKNFPLNYMITIRRFYDKITLNDLKKPGTLKPHTMYIGYDMRYGDLMKENVLIRKMESLSYNENDEMLIYETYNNPMDSILQQCKEKNITYTQPYKHCIRIKVNDYEKLKLVSTISDFL